MPAQISGPVLLYIRNRRSRNQVKDWEANGKQGATPHIIKQRIIREFARKFKCNILVESGTYLGDMMEAQKERFDLLFSIELSPDLWKQAVARFKGQEHVTILQGDSGRVMSNLVPGLNARTLFWLDGHYSGGITAKGDKECPVDAELDAIIGDNARQHIILIDDARLFNGTHDYPEYGALRDRILSRMPGYICNIQDDIICITPAG